MEPSTLFYPGSYSQNRTRGKLVSSHILTAGDLLWPLSLKDEEQTFGVETMPGVDCVTIRNLIDAAFAARIVGIDTIALFPPMGDRLEAWNDDHILCRAVRSVKSQVPGIRVICDATFVRQAVALAKVGCDIISPTNRNKINSIRRALDEQSFEQVRIMSYVTKDSSAFYGPANSDAALREVDFDLAEGASMIIVKPGLPYLDIVRRLKETFGVPTYACEISDESAMLRSAIDGGWIDEDATLEALMSLKRAGADGIMTSLAMHAAKRLRAE